MKVKKYLTIFFSVFILFIGFHFITWNLLTKVLFENVGDLARMSYLTDSLVPRDSVRNLAIKHIGYKKNTSADVITIGDSFSIGGGGGTNSFYQDYIATKEQLKVMNVEYSPQGFIETVLILKSSGILDEIKPKIIILETVERSAISRLSKEVDWDIGTTNISTTFLDKENINMVAPKPSFINKLNYNAVLYSILYKYKDNAFFSKVHIANLSKELFTCVDNKKLLFYKEDLKNMSLATEDSVIKLNNNLNRLQSILDKKNIKLYFMPAVDKYNLYSKYIIDNKHPKSNFFEALRVLDKNYYFVDTKMILEKLIDNDVKDVYYPDDTHWSYRASEEIVKKIDFKLD